MRVFVFAVLCALVTMWLVRRRRQRPKHGPIRTKSHKPVRALRMKPESHIPIVNLLQKHCHMFTSSQRWSSALSLARIYSRGSYPEFRPNVGLALLILGQIARCDDPDAAGEAQALYVDVRLHPVSSADVAGEALPKEFGEAVVLAAKKINHGTTHSQRPRCKAVKKIPQKTAPAPDQPQPPPRDIERVEPVHQLTRAEPRIVRRPSRVRARTRPVLQIQVPEDDDVVVPPEALDPRVDPQNVHEHSVAAATKVELLALLKKHGSIQLLPVLELAGNAKKVFESLSSQKHSAFGVSEQEALALVHAEITSHIHKYNLEETLLQRLNDCIEGGKLVCSTGKITRIVSTLQGLEGSSRMRPIYAVKEELASMAAHVRERILSDVSPQEKRSYAEGNSEDLSASMRTEFERQAMKQYVGELLMSQEVIAPLVSLYSQGF